MFADEEDVIPKKSDAKGGEKSESAPRTSAAAAAGAAAGAAAAASNSSGAAAAQQTPAAAAAAAEPDVVDYSSWPVKELRRFLTERGVDSSSIVEKGDLVSEVSRDVLNRGSDWAARRQRCVDVLMRWRGLCWL
jgi:CD2 antigen cytoplasmic tail-binding protein 2